MRLTGALQVIQFLWSFTIFGIAWRIVSGQGADDTRSDDEGYVSVVTCLSLLADWRPRSEDDEKKDE
jgi:hypothetical protein